MSNTPTHAEVLRSTGERTLRNDPAGYAASAKGLEARGEMLMAANYWMAASLTSTMYERAAVYESHARRCMRVLEADARLQLERRHG